MAIYRHRLRGVRGLGDASEWFASGSDPSGWTTDAWGDIVPATPDAGGGGILGTGVTMNQAIDTIKSLWLSGQQAEAQQKVIDLNMQRARAGLQPLPGSYFQPQAQVNVGLSPQVQTLVKWAAIGVLGWGLVHALTGR